MALRDKYNYAVQTAKQLRMDGSAEEREGKLYFNGTVGSEDEKNQIWNALKTIPEWQKEVVADIKVRPGAAAQSGGGAAAPAAGREQTYTVQPGDTLGAIAERFLGDKSAYRKLFDLNRDQLNDPDRIEVGQVLKIPAMR